jgi:hypothetical protein
MFRSCTWICILGCLVDATSAFWGKTKRDAVVELDSHGDSHKSLVRTEHRKTAAKQTPASNQLPSGIGCFTIGDRAACCGLIDGRVNDTVYSGQRCIPAAAGKTFEFGQVCDVECYVKGTCASKSQVSVMGECAVPTTTTTTTTTTSPSAACTTRTLLPKDVGCYTITDARTCCSSLDGRTDNPTYGGGQKCVPSASGKSFEFGQVCDVECYVLGTCAPKAQLNIGTCTECTTTPTTTLEATTTSTTSATTTTLTTTTTTLTTTTVTTTTVNMTALLTTWGQAAYDSFSVQSFGPNHTDLHWIDVGTDRWQSRYKFRCVQGKATGEFTPETIEINNLKYNCPKMRLSKGKSRTECAKNNGTLQVWRARGNGTFLLVAGTNSLGETYDGHSVFVDSTICELTKFAKLARSNFAYAGYGVGSAGLSWTGLGQGPWMARYKFRCTGGGEVGDFSSETVVVTDDMSACPQLRIHQGCANFGGSIEIWRKFIDGDWQQVSDGTTPAGQPYDNGATFVDDGLCRNSTGKYVLRVTSKA